MSAGCMKKVRSHLGRFGKLITLLVAFALAALSRSAAQGTRYTIVTNGPTSKRVNLAVLSEGYTTNQVSQFLTHATNLVNTLLARQPYLEYSNYFNAFGIFVASAETGSDHPVSGVLKNTYFNSGYDTNFDYVITIPPDYRDTNANNGQGKVDALLQVLLPETNRLAILLVNDFQSGGSGSPALVATSLNFPPYHFGAESDIPAHESGHTFGGLADEYTNTLPSFVPVEKPNATAQTNRALIKWTAWISTNTPVPTPDVSSNYALVGLFQGAEYQTTGWYRPKHDCKMNNLGTAFCEVCSEQLVKSIYTQIRPIDSFSPATTNISIYSTQAVSFSVTPLQPLTHNLVVQWQTNGVTVPGATNSSFQLAPKLLANGTNTLRAIVSDPTPLARIDPANLLKATNSWTLAVSLNELSLVAAQFLSNSHFRFTVTGAAPQGFVLQFSANLVNWSSLQTNTLSAGKYDFTNANLSNVPMRFYRAISPP